MIAPAALCAALIAAVLLALGWVVWKWQKNRKNPKPPGLPRDGALPLSTWERDQLTFIEAGYGDTPEELLRRLR